MKFTSFYFIVFFLVLYLIYWSVKGRSRLILLFAGSMLFYAAWSVPFLIHFLVLVLVNYLFVRQLHRRAGRALLAAILAIDVANLVFFKYFYFLLHIVVDVTGLSAFAPAHVDALLRDTTGAESILQPLGISFYTFQLIAYVVDVYRGNVPKQHTFVEFATFITLFLQLTAGPILRQGDFFEKNRLDRNPDGSQMLRAVALLQLGLAKKIVLADNIGALIRPVFQQPELYDGLSCAMAVLGYAVQVFSDFSGYTDLARGLALLLGLEYPENFAGPYLSRSVSEFWRRWHITLSSWLRDYIYIPLGGSRVSAARTSLNLIITFTIGGIWHGANYTFAIWGLSAGIFLAIERLLSTRTSLNAHLETWRERPWLRRLTDTAGVAYAFSVFLLGAVFFNSPDVDHALTLLHRLVSSVGGLRPNYAPHLFMLLLVFGLNWLQKRPPQITMRPARAWALLGISGLVLMVLVGQYAQGGQNFIYNQF